MSDHGTKRAKWLTLAGVVVLVAACSGGTAGPTTVAATQGGSGSTSAPSTQAAATQTTGGGTGTFAGKVCDLLTAAEIQAVMSVTGVTSAETPIANNSGYCLYSASDDIAVATSVLLGTSASIAWTTYSTGLGADGVLVSGIGDGAVFVKSSATLFVWKGGVLVGLTAGTGADSEATRMDWEKQLASKVVGRL